MAQYITGTTALRFLSDKKLPHTNVNYSIDIDKYTELSKKLVFVERNTIKDDMGNYYTPVHSFEIDSISNGIRKTYNNATIESQLAGSTFTIEAIAHDVKDNTTVELYGALSDYNNNILKARHPNHIHWEDVLNMAILSCAKNEKWTIDTETYEIIKGVVANRWKIPPFKIIKKFTCDALKQNFSHNYFETLRTCGALNAIYPEIKDDIVFDLLILKLKKLGNTTYQDKLDGILPMIPVPDIGIICIKFKLHKNLPIIALLKMKMSSMRLLESRESLNKKDITEVVETSIIPFIVNLKDNDISLSDVITDNDPIKAKILKSIDVYYSMNFTTLTDKESQLTKSALRDCLFTKKINAIANIWSN